MNDLSVRALSTLLCLGMAGCTGFIASPPTPESLAGESCVEVLQPRRIVRLTDRQYNNSLRALLEAPRLAVNFESPSSAPTAFLEDLERLPVGEALASLYQSSAESVAALAVGNAAQLLACPLSTTRADACVRGWLKKFLAIAYRRPAIAEEVEEYAQLFDVGAAEGAAPGGLELVVQAALQAPSFLYRTELGASPVDGKIQLTDYELATQLAFWLSESPPDTELRIAAAAGRLSEPSTLRAQASRLLALPRTQEMLTEAYLRWSGLSDLPKKTKDPSRFPSFTDARASLVESGRLFISDTLWNGSRDLGRLYTSREVFVDAKVAPFYGVPIPAGDGFKRVQVPIERAGLLTHPAFLARYGSETEGQVVQRGAFVSKEALCTQLELPPGGLDILGPGKNLTELQFAQYRASTAACKGCHAAMDPYGLVLSAFDAVGSYRPSKDGEATGTRVRVIGTDFDGEVSDAAQLGARLGASKQAAACTVAHLLSLSVARPVKAQTCAVERLNASFLANGRQVSGLITDIVLSQSFQFRQP